MIAETILSALAVEYFAVIAVGLYFTVKDAIQ